MNLQNFRSSICGYHHTVTNSIRSACLKCVPSCLRRHHQVHPIHLHYDNCEFLQLHPQRRIRVIHYNSQDEPDTTDSNSKCEQEKEVPNPHESATLDDYWFVRGSHSSFRLFKNKSRDISSLEAPSKHSKLHGGPLDGIRYSFHKREKLKTCIEENLAEPINQIKTLDSVINNLVSVIIEEAITFVVHKKHQRSHKTTSLECLPQIIETITLVKNNSVLQNGNAQIVNDRSELSGRNNVAFVSDESNSSVENPSCESRLQGESVKSESDDKASDVPPRNSQDPGDKKQNIKSQSKKSSSKQPSKPLLLFLHGAGGSAEEWSSLLTYFATAGYEIVAPDLLGHGLSSAPHAPRAYTFACLLQDALQIFDTFAPEPRKCVVIGHGYGCSFAAAVARYRPQSVVQLVLISGGGPTPLAPHRGIYSLPRCLLGCAKPLLLCGFRREYFYAARGKQLMFGEHWDVPSYVWSHMYKGQEWPQGDTAFHRRISVPTLLVHGMNDPHITLVEECEMERTIPRSFLEILPGAGHKAMLDAPEPLSHMLHCFITLWDKSGALSK